MTEVKENGLNNPAFVNDEAAPAATTKGAANGSAVVAIPTKVLNKEEQQEKMGMLKNVIVISFAFTFLFTAFNSMSNLQSSINKVSGTMSLSVLYAALVFSCAFIPTWMIKTLKAKWTLVISMLGYSLYIAAQFYPSNYTLVPTAIVLGLGAAPMWSAKCTYITQVGNKYAELTGENSEVVITRFFGIFFLFFQSTQIWGNLISSAVLSQGVEDRAVDEIALAKCGINFCPGEPSMVIEGNTTDSSVSNLEAPDMTKIYIIATIFLICALVSSVIIAFLVDPLSKYGENERQGSSSGKSGLQLLVATFQHMRHPYQILIIPLTIWSGVEQAFIQADITAAYVSCGLGVHWVGYIMITYGVCDAICSVSFSPLVSMVGRVPIFTMGAVINICVIITLQHWMPHPDDFAIFFIIAGLWGISDAVWQTQINAFYGVIFPGASEAAFSNYRFWESLGYVIAFICSGILCIDSKIIILVFFLSTGMIGYLTIEILERFDVLPRNSMGQIPNVDELISNKNTHL
ncbi:unnamed protein product [Meganyctiphanes norvegica]|uniref:UNC93-like protein n=1 Tax=Meganyctiphanes norvegica TaxID=48144 RepID=A0AAV2R496_MEGNR